MDWAWMWHPQLVPDAEQRTIRPVPNLFQGAAAREGQLGPGQGELGIGDVELQRLNRRIAHCHEQGPERIEWDMMEMMEMRGGGGVASETERLWRLYLALNVDFLSVCGGKVCQSVPHNSSSK